MPDFNSPKNPLPDLMPLEEDRSTEVSSQELSAIRASLMETSWRTEQIVDVLERKNILLERDLEKITNLKRRLRRSIGIIPGMPGKAGALFGAGVGMGLILPFGFKWPESESPNIPPIGKPQPPLTPEPSPVYVPVDVPQPVPIDVPVTVPDTVPDVIPDTVPDIINVPNLVPDSIDIPDPRAGWGGLEDILNPDGTGVIIGDPGPVDIPVVPGKDGEVEIPHQGGELVQPGALPTGAYAWVDDLNPLQAWEILKFNMDKPYTWALLAAAGLTMASLLFPGDAQTLAIFGTTVILSKIKYAIAAGIFLIPPLLNSSATAGELSNNSSNNNTFKNIDSSTSSSDIASLQLNTRKTDTFVIITDQPIA